MIWQTEYVAFDSDTGFTLRVYQPGQQETDPWTWRAYDPDMEEISDDFIENYNPQERATMEEARQDAIDWYGTYKDETEAFENDDF